MSASYAVNDISGGARKAAKLWNKNSSSKSVPSIPTNAFHSIHLFLFSLYTCTGKIPEYCHKQHSHHSRVLHQYILFVHSAATSTTRLSPYKHLKSILEHS